MLSNALHIVGVYLPCDDAHAAHRPNIYKHLSRIITEQDSGDTLLITGDWNAGLEPGDRQGQPTAADRAHKEWVADSPQTSTYMAIYNTRQAPDHVLG